MTTTGLPPLIAAALLAAAPLAAQQVADTVFRPVLAPPLRPEGGGPVIAIDAGHHNFHTLEGRYAPFAAVLRRDGYLVRGHEGPLSAASLRGVRVLVIANPVHASNARDWTLPNPSAFTAEEIAAVRRFVEAGGALLLIADHMPFAGAAEELGRAFGLEWTNGFAFDSTADGPMPFRRSDGSLLDHPVTRGIDSVFSFTGSAFRLPSSATSLMRLGPNVVSLNPNRAWQFDSATVRVPVGGWSQGALLAVGRGRVAAFGEAAMFSAQLAGPRAVPMGMNHPLAASNGRFLANVIRWLSGDL